MTCMRWFEGLACGGKRDLFADQSETLTLNLLFASCFPVAPSLSARTLSSFPFFPLSLARSLALFISLARAHFLAIQTYIKHTMVHAFSTHNITASLLHDTSIHHDTYNGVCLYVCMSLCVLVQTQIHTHTHTYIRMHSYKDHGYKNMYTHTHRGANG